MSRKKSEFLKSAGKMWEIMQAITNALLEMGGNDDDLHRLLTDSSLAKKVANVIMVSKQKVQETYKVVVDYSQTLAEMISAGNYNWFKDDINDEHFPVQGAGQQEVDLELVHLNRNATTKEVLEELNSQGLEPAKIEHLLAFSAIYPDVQREFPVVVLGSSFVGDDGYRYCPYLHCLNGERGLNLDWRVDDSPWRETCRFLAFRK